MAIKFLEYVDHTVLAQTATYADVDKICEEAVEYKTASVCIPPSYVEYAAKKYEGLNVCTVIGFPNGYSTTETKVFETKDAIAKGATEIDMVINVGWVKNGEWDKVLEEIKAIKAACGDVLLKVIVETCFLSDDEKAQVSKVVTEAKAEYIKTSTGFGGGGATVHDVKILKENIGENVKIKASGGISTLEDVEAFLELGVSRLGASKGVAIYKELEGK